MTREPGLPAWAVVSPKRQEHIERVVALLARWADALHLSPDEANAWRDAGYGHDALRDENESVLRAMTGEETVPVGLLHGPAAATRFADEGEHRADVLDAIRWHTVGSLEWNRVGRALYMADFLEPGRTFMRPERAFLANAATRDFDGTFYQVVRMRLEWTLREGKLMQARTVALWNSLA